MPLHQLLTNEQQFVTACSQALVINAHGGKTTSTFNLDGHVLLTPDSLLTDYTYSTANSQSAVEKHIKQGELKPIQHGQWTAYGLDSAIVPDVKLQLLSGTIKSFANQLQQHESWKGINEEIDNSTGHYCDKDPDACLIIQKSDGTYISYKGDAAKKILDEIIQEKYNLGIPVCFYAPKVNKCKILSDIRLSQILPEIKKIAGERMFVLATCNAGSQPKSIHLDHKATSIPLKNVLTKTNPNVTAINESDLQKISDATGSNPGGQYKNNIGNLFYVKFPHRRLWDGNPNGNATHGSQKFGKEMGNSAVKNEVLAAKFYQLGEIRVPTLSLVKSTDSGCLGIASEIVSFNQYTQLSKEEKSQVLNGTIPGLYEGFAFDAWLGVWDVYGVMGDNIGIVTHTDGRKEVMRIDVGGALEYRACGLLKGHPDGHDFTQDIVAEINTLKAKNKIFATISEEEIKKGVAKIAKISDETIIKMIQDNGGPGDLEAQKRLAEKLIQRKNFLMNKYGLSADIVTFNKGFELLTEQQKKSATTNIHGPELVKMEAKQFHEELTQKGKGINNTLYEPTFEQVIGKQQSAGVLIVEDDGRIWLYKPKNAFGGYSNTFPKGRLDDGESAQRAAVREAFEETGLQVEIIGHLGDFEKSTTNNRYYVARRIGGAPFGWKGTDSQPLQSGEKEETEAVILVNPSNLDKLEKNNTGIAAGKDAPIISTFLEMQKTAMQLGEGHFFRGVEIIEQKKAEQKKAQQDAAEAVAAAKIAQQKKAQQDAAEAAAAAKIAQQKKAQQDAAEAVAAAQQDQKVATLKVVTKEKFVEQQNQTSLLKSQTKSFSLALIEEHFNLSETKQKLPNIEFIKPQIPNTEIIGHLRLTETQQILANIKQDAIECPLLKENRGITFEQQQIFIEFLKFQSKQAQVTEQEVIVKAKNFSPTELTNLLKHLEEDNLLKFIKLQLPEFKSCSYGNNTQYTNSEYTTLSAKIDQYNKKIAINHQAVPPLDVDHLVMPPTIETVKDVRNPQKK